MNCIPNQHIIILILIIVFIGAFAGLTNFLTYYFKDLANKKSEIYKYVISGIGASILVPLLLNMLSSNLIKDVKNFDQINYFVFAGFCFVAGYFSDRFINSMGEKVLQDLEKTKQKAEKAIAVSKQTEEKADKAIASSKENEDKIDFIVSTESDNDSEELDEQQLEQIQSTSKYVDDAMKTQANNILLALNGDRKFRSSPSIAKELNYPVLVVKTILENFEKHGIVKKLALKDRPQILWSLTNVGKMAVPKKE
jgi:hypothetical protein